MLIGVGDDTFITPQASCHASLDYKMKSIGELQIQCESLKTVADGEKCKFLKTPMLHRIDGLDYCTQPQHI